MNVATFTGNVGATASTAFFCGRHTYAGEDVRLARGSNQHQKRWAAPCHMCGKTIVWVGKPPRHWKAEP